MDDAALIAKLSGLARFDVTADEQASLTAHLPKILAYVGQLQKVATDIVAAPEGKPARWRPDAAQPSRAVEDILAAAPARQERYFAVKSVFSYA